MPAASHPRFRAVVIVAAPWIFGAAALAYGYVPVLLRDEIQGFGIAYATLLTVVSLGVAAVVQPAARRLDSEHSARGLTTALAVLTAAVAGIGLVVITRSPLLGVATSAAAGAGIGIALSTGLLEVQRIAGRRQLAGLIGLFYAIAYLGFLLPTAMAAVAPAVATPQLLAALVLAGCACTATVAVNSRKHLPLRAAGPVSRPLPAQS